MTEKTQNAPQLETKELEIRNREVTKCYNKAVEASKALLKPFTEGKYRTNILIDHTQSLQKTNHITEFLTCFFTITLTRNRVGYLMIYFTYDDSAIERFGARLYNRALRQVFKNTSVAVVEDSVRVNNPRRVEPFFNNRLSYGVKPHVQISTVSKD